MATVREMLARYRSPTATSRAVRNRQRRGGALREMWYIIPGQAELAYSDDEDEEDDDLEEIEEEEEELEVLEDEEEKQPASLPTPPKKSMVRPPLFPNLPLRMPLPPLRSLSSGDVAHREEEEEEEEKEEEEAQEIGAEIDVEHTYVPLTVAPAVGPDVDVQRPSSSQQEMRELIVEEVKEEKETMNEESMEQRVEERLLQDGGRPATPAYDRM